MDNGKPGKIEFCKPDPNPDPYASLDAWKPRNYSD